MQRKKSRSGAGVPGGPRPRVAAGRRVRAVAGAGVRVRAAVGAGARARRLVAALAALVLSLALATVALATGGGSGASGAGAEGAPVAGGSAVGILLSADPAADGQDPALAGQASYLGVLLAPGGFVPRVVFWSQGEVYSSSYVPYGEPVADPGRPAWDWGKAGTFGFSKEAGDRPVFAGWCLAEDDAQPGRGTGAAFAFDGAATEKEYAFYAAWEDASDDESGGLLTIGLDLDGGELAEVSDPVTGKTLAGGGPMIERRVGQPYRWLPEPIKRGHAFAGWVACAADGSSVAGGSAGEGASVSAETAVAAGTAKLRAVWEPAVYTVVYIDRSDGYGAKCEQSVTYGKPASGTEKRFLSWEEAAARGLTTPSGKQFAGWADARDWNGDASTGRVYQGGAVMTEDLVDEDGGRVALYAQWRDAPKDVCSVKLHYGYAVGGAETVELSVEAGGTVIGAEGYVEPKRAGYQFAGWHTDAACSPSSKWEPTRVVLEDVELWAKWDLRLDVTVPVSVGFAVDADSGEATGPDEGRYALKSRTVAEVVVEEAALESRQDELEGFFELKDAAGAGEDVGGEGGSGDAAWAAALEKTALSLGAGGETVSLPFAGTPATGEDGATVWKSARELGAGERAVFRMDAFAYGGTAFDEAWQGGLPCKTLPLRLGLTVPIDQLKVRTAVDGPQKVTRLVLTVSATG